MVWVVALEGIFYRGRGEGRGGEVGEVGSGCGVNSSIDELTDRRNSL